MTNVIVQPQQTNVVITEEIVAITVAPSVAAISVTEEVTAVTVTEQVTAVTVATPGPQGAPGEGVPVGGTANQVLAKIDGTNFNTEWVTLTAVWGAISGTLADQTDLQAALDAKANAADVYTKAEIDALLGNVVDFGDIT